MLISFMNDWTDTEFVNTDHIVRAVYKMPGGNAVLFIFLTNGTKIRLDGKAAVHVMQEIEYISLADMEAVDEFVTQSHASDAPAPTPVDTAANPERT